MRRYLLALMILMSPVASRADDLGLILHVDVGMMDTDSAGWKMGGDVGSGPVWDLGAGYRFNDYFRAEIAYAHRSGLEYSGTDGTYTVSGKARNSAAMATLYVDVPVAENVVPYVGIGAGRSWTKTEEAAYASGGLSGTRDGDSHATWAWQAVAGVGLRATRNVVFDIGYRYFDGGKIQLGDKGRIAGVSGTFSNAQHGELTSHELLSGIRFEF